MAERPKKLQPAAVLEPRAQLQPLSERPVSPFDSKIQPLAEMPERAKLQPFAELAHEAT